MPTLDDVYRKFGETAEAAQLLETELGNILFSAGALEENLIDSNNPSRARDLIDGIDASTLGKLVAGLRKKVSVPKNLEQLLSDALKQRNRLSHSFYREHNFRRNSDEGRDIMLTDLESMHETIIKAYKAFLLLSGVDLDSIVDAPLPTGHLPI